jgi:hypothetical protein
MSAIVATFASALLALVLVSLGAPSLAGLFLLTAVGLALYARHWLRLAGRSAADAKSEEEVRHVLAALENEGWRVRHSLTWRGRGDVDVVAIAPSRIAFAIETKTRTYHESYLAVVQQQARWLRR